MSNSPLKFAAENSPTSLWNDSADPKELANSISWGAVGATCNPPIALTAIMADLPHWTTRIKEYSQAHPTATDDEIGWAMVRELSVNAAKLLEPNFKKYNGRNGRLSIQTDPRLHRDAKALAEQAFEFSQLAENIIVKIPVTSYSIDAFEEATYRGVSINATVSFTVAQTLAVAEAVERGLKRREAEGLDISTMGPVCTIMVGRTDDWVRLSAEKAKAAFDPGIFEWAGIATFKNAYKIYQEKSVLENV
jgi:transaldolase